LTSTAVITTESECDHFLNESLDKRVASDRPLTEADIHEAAIEDAVHRLRPKLMTVCAVLASLYRSCGHPRLRARHSPFRINQAARDRWMRMMNNAFAEAALPEKAEQILREFLDEMSTFMINQPASEML
jgi:truncated hemoglobin YjbI